MRIKSKELTLILNNVKNLLAMIIIIAVFCLILPGTVEAAIAVDSYSSGGTIGTTITISHTTSGTNRLMLVGVSLNNDGTPKETVTGVTYNDSALTLVDSVANFDDARVEIWRLVDPDTGTHDVVVTFSADLLRSGVAGVMTFTGVDQTTPLGTSATAAADGTEATVDVSSATDELVFGVVAAETPTSLTVGSGQTEYWNLTVDGGITYGAGSTEPGATTVTTSWTLGSSDHWAIAGVPIKPAPIFPAPPNIPTLLRIFDNAIYNAWYEGVSTYECTLSVKSTDSEGDSIRYEIQWDTNPLLSSPSSKTTSYYSSGVEAKTTIDLESIDPEQVYYWNARAMTTTADWQYRKKITIDHIKVGVTPAPWYNTDWQYRNEITIDHTKVGVGISEAPWYDTDWQYRNKITIDHTKVSGEPWYNTDWQYCKKITVTAGSAVVPSGYTASVTLDHAALFSVGKSLVSGDDIRILHWNGSIWTELDRVLDPLSAWNDASTQTWFSLVDPIAASGSDSSYYLYYGNASASTPPDEWANVFMMGDDFDDGTLTSGVNTSIAGTASISETGGEAFIDLGTDSLTDAGIIAMVDSLPSDNRFAIRHKTKLVSAGGISNPEVKDIGIIQWPSQPTVDSNQYENPRRRIMVFHRFDQKSTIFHFKPAPGIEVDTVSTGTVVGPVEVDTVSSGSTTGSSITISHTTSGLNRLMLVGVSLNNENLETVTGVTYNSVALTVVGTRARNNDARVEIWRLVAPDTGTHDVVVTFSADLVEQGFAGVVTFTGVNQTTPLGTFASAAADGDTAKVNVSSAARELVFDVVATEYSNSLTAAAGQTEQWKLYLSPSYGAGSTRPGAGTVTMKWTLDATPTNHWAIGAVPVKPLSSSIITIPHTTSGTNRLMLVGVSVNPDGNEYVTDVTWNTSETLTKVRSDVYDDDARTEIWYLKNPTATTANVVVSFDQTLRRAAIAGVVTFTGVDQTTPLGDDNGANWIAESNPSITVTTEVGDMVFGVVCVEDEDITGTDADTEHWRINELGGPASGTTGGGGTKAGQASNTSIGWTFSGTDYTAISAVAINPVEIGQNYAWDSTAWVTGWGSWGDLSLDTYYIYELISDGTSWYIRVSDANGTELTTTSSVLWSNTADNGADPFWFYWGEVYTNYYYADVKSDWVYARKYINPEPTSALGTEEQPLTNFPVLISRTDADWKDTGNGGNVGQSDGGDILFTFSDGTTKLDHEIEKYVPSAGSLVAWVEVPALSASNDTSIYIYYGNGAAADQWNVTGTWNSDFHEVWHLDETSGSHYGSTSNNYVGTVQGTVNQNVTGKINGADEFVGPATESWISLADGTLTGDSPFTIEAWFQIEALASLWTGIVTKGREVDPADWVGLWLDDINRLIFGWDWRDAGNLNGSTLSASQWYYAVATFDGTDRRLYLDGALDAGPDGPASYSDIAQNSRIANDGDNTNYFDGIIDEVRISSMARAANWIATSYNNQSSPNTFYSVGSIEERALTNFPVLISRTDADWRDTGNGGRVGQSDGGDILFTFSDGITKLDHEIEKYVPSAGSLVAWVEVPTVPTYTDTSIYIYYGNATVADQWNITETWDSDYEMVQHMADATSSTIEGSTSNSITGTKGSADNPDEVDGQIGMAQDFDGATEYMTFEDHTMWNWTPVDQNRTFSFWFYPTTNLPSTDDAIQFLTGVSSGNHYQFMAANDGTNTGFACVIWDNAWSYIGYYGVYWWPPSLNTWYYITFLASTDGNNEFYVNGVSQSLDLEWSWDDNTLINPSSIEVKSVAGPSYGRGRLDEYRFSHTARSATWIITSYNNQNSPSTFYSVGITEEQALTNFPVLISRTDTDWKDTGNGGHVGQSDGGDIFFTSSDGTTKLDHEIEKYVPSAGSLVAWVEVDTVSALTDTDIYIYYGNATAANQWNVMGTWDEGGNNNYEAVWHLNESSGDHLDATGNGNNSTTMQVTQQGADIGKIDGADDFDGTDDYVDFGNLLDFSSTNFTIEVWFKPDVIDQSDQNTFISKWHATSGQREFRFEIDGNGPGNDTVVFSTQDATTYHDLGGATALTVGNWYYAVVTINWAGDDAYLYLNGAVDDSEVGTWTWGMNYETSPVYIACRRGVDQWFDGVIDEVRISTTDRSANWIATCYNNQDSPSTFYSVDAEEECINSLWSGIRSFTMDMDLENEYPYWYQVAGPQFEKDTLNNTTVQSNSVILSTGETNGSLTSLHIVYNDLKTENSNRNDWDGVKWTKSSLDDSIGVQIEYKNVGVWTLVPDVVIGTAQGFNSIGFFDMTSNFCTVDLTNIGDPVGTEYDTLRIKVLFKSYSAKSANDPVLLMLALGNTSGSVTGISTIDKPMVFTLYRNRPNPFTNGTEIRYQIPKRVKVELQVFDVMGRSVVTLVNKEQKPGYYSIQWRGMNKNKKLLPSGIYFLRMEAGDFKATQKMVRLR